MIYVSKVEVHALFIPALPLKVKFVAKHFLKNKLLSPLFNSVKFSLRPKNEWIALVAFKLSVAIRVSQIGSTGGGDNLAKMTKNCMKHPPARPLWETLGVIYLKKEAMTYQQAQFERCLLQSHLSSII